MSAAPGPIQRAAYRVWLAVGAVALIWVAWQVLAHPLAVIFPPLLLATVIVYLLAPIVAALEHRGVPRWVGALLAYLGAALAVALLGAIMVPLLNDQLQAFSERLPELLSKLGRDLDRRLAPLGINVPLAYTTAYTCFGIFCRWSRGCGRASGRTTTDPDGRRPSASGRS